MVDIIEISAIIAAAGVIVGVFYYILEIRHEDRMRHLDLFMSLYSTWGSPDMLDAHRRLMVLKVESYDSWVKEHGSVAEPTQLNTEIDRLGWFFNLMGFFVKEKIVHIKLVDELLGYWVLRYWETVFKPLAHGWRKQYNIPESYHWFEYLYNEMKKRQQPASKTA
jgi:hypothetical protein